MRACQLQVAAVERADRQAPMTDGASRWVLPLFCEAQQLRGDVVGDVRAGSMHMICVQAVQNGRQLLSGGNDTVTMLVGNPPTIHSISAPDNMLTLAGNWQVAEFNIFGDSCSSQAVFQGAPTIVARTSLSGRP
jgi:hypothetical protein